MACSYTLHKSFLLSIVLSALAVSVAMAGPLSGSAEWQQQTKDDGSEKTDSLTEKYSLNVAKKLDITEVMGLNASIRINRSKDEDETQDIIVPAAIFSINNDLFYFSLSGNANERKTTDAPDFSTRVWETTWNSNWNQSLLKPALSLFYANSRSFDDLKFHQQDTQTDRSGGVIDWNLGDSEIYYSYNWQEGQNFAAESVNVQKSHLARFETSKSFWNDRINVGFSQQYSQQDQEITTSVGAGGVALVEVTISQTSAGQDATPDSGTLAVTPGLSDNNKLDQALQINDPPDPMNIGIKVDFSRVDLIYFYTVNDISANASDFTWNLYSSPDGISWSLEASNVTYSYNGNFKRFEIEATGVQNRYIKLVTMADPVATAIDFSEIETYQRITSTAPQVVTESQQKNHFTNANIGIELRPDLRLAYNGSYEKSMSSSGIDMEQKRVSSSLDWKPSSRFTSSLNASASLQKSDNSAESLSRTFGLNFYTLPIAALDLAWGFTLNEMYEGRTKTSTSQNYNINTTAALFRDLDSRLNLTYSTVDDEATQDRTSQLDANLVFTARLIPKLVLTLNSGYSRTLGDPTPSSTTVAMGLNWRPSDMLALRIGGTQSMAESDSTNASINIDLKPTEKIQLSAGYSYSHADETVNNYSLNWRWFISNYFTLLTTASFQDQELTPDSWSIDTKLLGRYSGL